MAHFLFNKPTSIKTKIRTSPPRQAGQFLIELLIAMAIMGLLLPVLLGGLVIGRDTQPDLQRKAQARQVLQSTTEIMRIIRERGWEFVATNGTFHPVVDGTSWQLAEGSDSVNGITRQIILEPVRRLNFASIVPTGGSIDPSTKKVTVRLTWANPSNGQLESTFYMTRYLDNITLIDTDLADFEAGTHTGTTPVSTSGEDGQVILGTGGRGGWCNPLASEVLESDLPGQSISSGIFAIPGRAFVSTGANASGNPFSIIAITDNYPPSTSIAFSYQKNYKGNDVVGDENYAYVSTDTNSREVIIVNTNGSPTADPIGYFDAPANVNGISLAVQGSIGYVVTSNNKLYPFDLASKSGARANLYTPTNEGMSLSGTPTKIRIRNQYAYVTLSSGANKLQIISLQNPNQPVVVGQANFGNTAAVDVSINDAGTVAFVATAYSASNPEVYAVDISTKTGNRPVIGSYNTGAMNPKGITLVPGNRLIVAGHGGEQYQVLVLNYTASAVGMTYCGGLNLGTLNANGVASVWEQDNETYSYLITTNSSKEFKMLEGGPGGQFSNTGTFESQIFDVGYETAFNYVIAQAQTTPQTSFSFQVAVADAVNDSCQTATFHYLGPGGDPSAFYTSEGPILLDDDGVGFENPGRCFRYKAYFSSSDSSQSPVLEAMQINYSP